MTNVSDFVGKTISKIAQDDGIWAIFFETGECIHLLKREENQNPFFSAKGEHTTNDIPLNTWAELFQMLPG